MARSTARRSLLAVAVVSAVGLALAGAPSAASAQGSAAVYYRTVPVCAAPAPGHAQCFAVRRVRVSTDRVPGAVRAEPLPSRVAAGPAGGFTPADLATAYGVNPNAATNQVVAVVGAFNDPNARADLSTFDSHYGLPAETATSLRIVNEHGKPAPLPATDTTGWSVEESLDLDAVRGLCHTCSIILVEADDDSGTNLATGVNAAVALHATEVSNSYGGAENDPTDPPTAFEAAAYNHPGVVIGASAGDDGYVDWDYANANPAFDPYAPTPQPDDTVTSSGTPETPSSYNTVVAVGGTTLQLNDDGTRSGESVWNENGTFDNTGYAAATPQGATGGGCSTINTAQRWQYSVAGYASTACGHSRLTADVSALADPNTGYDIYDSFVYTTDTTVFKPGWATLGGTSLSTPLVMAMWALAGGSGGVKYPSLSLYGHRKSVPGSLYDVTVGGNGYCAGVSPTGCAAFGNPNTTSAGVVDCAWDAHGSARSGTRACEAAVGYDGPTGVGTPRGLSAFRPLNPHAVLTAARTITHGRSAAFSGRSSTDPFPGGAVTHWRWSFGDRGTSTSSAPTHRYAGKGNYVVTLTVSDTYGRSATVSKRVVVR